MGCQVRAEHGEGFVDGKICPTPECGLRTQEVPAASHALGGLLARP